MTPRPRHDTPPMRTVEPPTSEAERNRTLESAAVSEPASPESGRYPSLQQAGGPELVPEEDAARLSTRWDVLQAGFVDDPRAAVSHADELVGEVVERVITQFAQQRAALERQWDRGDQATTEELRVALTRYREFFRRLLSVRA